MSIQNDAGELLALFYKDKIEGKEIKHSSDIKKETNWDWIRIINALEYLIDKNLLRGKALKSMGSTLSVEVIVNGLTSSGIDIMENQEEFKGTFGFGINVGLFNFSWQNK